MALRYRQYLFETRPASPFTVRIGDVGGAAGCEPAELTDAISFVPDTGAELAPLSNVGAASSLPAGTAVDPRWRACGGATLDAKPRVGRSPSKPDPANGSPPTDVTLDAGVGCWPAFSVYVRTLLAFEVEPVIPSDAGAA